jgi:hypothetical protein
VAIPSAREQDLAARAIGVLHRANATTLEFGYLGGKGTPC